jgi:hypothetical protein
MVQDGLSLERLPKKKCTMPELQLEKTPYRYARAIIMGMNIPPSN